MQISTANNVKVYNLSAGKSLPEWISDRKKRTLLKNDVGKLSRLQCQILIIISIIWPFRVASSNWTYSRLWNAHCFLTHTGTKLWPENLSNCEWLICCIVMQVTEDKQYILAAGVYKPRVRCYDIHQLSMKFERCFDAEVVNMSILSEDYSKVFFYVMLWCSGLLLVISFYGLVCSSAVKSVLGISCAGT